MILGYAAYMAYWIVSRRTGWVWLVLDAVFFLAGGLLLCRSRWARHLMWLSASLYAGAWLHSTLLAMVSTWNAEPLLVDILMLVPGIALVICPSVYGVYVAHAYTASKRA